MDFIQSESGGTAMTIGALLAYAAVIAWAWRDQRKDRWFVVAAATGTAVVVVLANAVAHAAGWWEWWGYALPLVVQGGLLFVLPSVLFTLILTGYRWLESHSRHPLPTYGLVSLIVLVPLTVIGDLYNMERGKLSFGRGYTIWQDILVGQVFFWLPVLLYKALRR